MSCPTARFLTGLALAGTLTLAGPVAAQNAQAAAEAPAAKAEPLSRLAKLMLDNGHKTCISTLDSAVKWVHEDDAGYAYHNQWNQSAPDQRTAFAISSEKMSDTTRITAFTSTLDASGKCSTGVVQIMHFQESCPKLRETALTSWKYKGEIGASTLYELGDGSPMTIYLTPLQENCLLVKLLTGY